MCLKKDKGRDLRIMKSMKKVFGALLTLVLCLGLVGCGGGSGDSSNGGDISGKITLNGSTSME